MQQTMTEQQEVDVLKVEFKEYIRELQFEWLAENRVHSKDVFEVMRPEEQQKVFGRIAQWSRYITPVAEAWWKERGYGVIWPDDDSESMKVYKLESD